MKKVTVVIVDDERSAREEIKRMLVSLPNYEVIGEASNADDAKGIIEKLKPKLIFLDIEMPEKSGFNLLEILVHLPFVIFTTAYNQYAVKAFEVNAVDYLMKPIRIERFEKALMQVEEKIDRNSESIIYVKDGRHIHAFKWSEVWLIESLANYAKVHYNSGVVLLKQSLNQLEARLDPLLFFRANRTQLFNISFLEMATTNIDGKTNVKLKPGEHIALSTRQASKFKTIIKK